MTRITITTNIKQASQTVKGVNGMILRVNRLKLQSLGEKVVKRMRAIGKKITYPVKWDSPRQRRAFFASNGFGRGIPTKRTGAYIKGWRLVRAKQDAWRIENNTKGANYIGGNRQSRIHKGRWASLQAAIQTELAKFPAELRADIIRASKDIKGITIK